MWKRIMALCAAACVLFSVSMSSLFVTNDKAQKEKLVLYSTDLSIDGDFDDYFDLVVMKSLENIDLKIIVDGNDRVQKRSGVEAIRNLEKIAGGGYDDTAEVIIGRDHNLKSFYDADVDKKLVKLLEEATGKIDIVTVGSLRDVAALYNHCPELFEEKVEKIWVFAGDAEGTMREYNVALDENAFLRIMNFCKTDIYWFPCFQNGIWTTGSNTSYFTVRHGEVLENADDRLLKWFFYRYEKSRENFQNYTGKNIDIDVFMEESRNLWCAPLFPLIDGSMDDYWAAYNQESGLRVELPFGFSEQNIMFSEGGKAAYGEGNRIHVFEIYDYDEYLDFMKYVLRHILRNWILKKFV